MKRFHLFILAFAAIGCSKSPEPKTVSVSEDASQWAARYFRTFNSHNWQALSELYADSVEMKDPAFGNQPVWFTRKKIEEKYKELQSQIPDLADSVVSVLNCGDKMVVEFISTGTTPDSSRFRLPVCTIFEKKKGLIIHDYTYYDNF